MERYVQSNVGKFNESRYKNLISYGFDIYYQKEKITTVVISINISMDMAASVFQ